MRYIDKAKSTQDNPVTPTILSRRGCYGDSDVIENFQLVPHNNVLYLQSRELQPVTITRTCSLSIICS